MACSWSRCSGALGRPADGRGQGRLVRAAPLAPVDSPGPLPLRIERFRHACSHPRRPAQRRDRRPRRPRQDHAGRRHALAVRRVLDAPGRGGVGQRAGHGLDGPGAREGHHDPRQEHRGAAPHRRPGRDDQHHRHPGPRRLRRRGRARAGDGRRRRCCWSTPARGRCRRPGSCCARRCRPSCPSCWWSTRSTGRTPGSPRSSTRPTSCSSTSTPTEDADRLPDRLLPGQGRPGVADPARRTASMPDDADLEPLFDTHPRRRSRHRRTTTGAPLQAHVTNLDASPYLGRLALCRVHQGTITQGPDGRLVPHRRHDRAGQDHRAADDRGAGPGAGRVGRPRRHHRHRRHPGDHHRRDAGRPRRPAAAAGDHRRRADASR